ncbi:hypothetical protein KC573_00165 [candidate division WWE3 bacterium]|uniref:Uncharacterized protein n=1 Tax=candidate division WWE3 bacterium TaxID=2053526 RepID=A0A955LVC8_UNCKA|nr:hypothetical protein [candidate division WWE3 bacterium]
MIQHNAQYSGRLNNLITIFLLIVGVILTKKYGRQMAELLDKASADPAYFTLK